MRSAASLLICLALPAVRAAQALPTVAEHIALRDSSHAALAPQQALGHDRAALAHDSTNYAAELKAFFFQAEDGIRDYKVTGVQTCALPIFEIRIPENGSTIEYEEWGNGMDLVGLREFLTKGKLTDEGFSPKYKRPIRESYGMGSLAWLTVGKELELQVHRGRFDRTITLTENLIDKYWDAIDQSTWRPLRLIQAPLDHDGLRIRIRSLIKKPDPADVRRALLARANVLALRGYGPFEVTVNGEQVKPEELRGSTLLPVNIATEYGRITGEIMIMPISKVRAGISEAGISVQQKHITCLQHQFFGLDQ